MNAPHLPNWNFHPRVATGRLSKGGNDVHGMGVGGQCNCHGCRTLRGIRRAKIAKFSRLADRGLPLFGETHGRRHLMDAERLVIANDLQQMLFGIIPRGRRKPPPDDYNRPIVVTPCGGHYGEVAH